jgi:hypothetical protein
MVKVVCLAQEKTMMSRPYVAFAAVALGAAVLTTGCGEPARPVSEEVRSYTLLSQNAPKHYYVTLRDTQTQQVHEKVYVSKHCNSFRQNVPGATYQLRRVTYEGKEGRFTRFEGLYSAFCERPAAKPAAG